MRIRTITEIKREKEDGTVITHRLVARDKEGINEITMVSAKPFKGMSAKSGIIQVVLDNSQLTIDDFEEKDEE